MRSIRLIAVIAAALLGLVSCNRDPEVAKRGYLESGNKYFARGKYREARIFYKDAIQKDKLFGEAYYRLGLTALKIAETKEGSLGEAVQALRRAVELLDKETEKTKPGYWSPQHWDAVVKLSELYMVAGSGQKEFADEVERFVGEMLKRDKNSWDGHRLKGDLQFSRAVAALRQQKKEEALALIDASLAEYQLADSIKPNQTGVLMQMARVRSGKGEIEEAEKLFRRAVEIDKTNKLAYTELYRLLVLQRKYPAAEQILRAGFQANPKDYDLLVILAMHHSALNQKDQMVAALQQIKSSVKDYPEAYQKVGDFYLQINDAENALREFREGMGKDPKNKLVYQKRIIEALMRQGKRTEAADVNAQILKDYPTDTDAKNLAAGFMLDQGDVTRALTELQAVVSRAPDNPVARFNLGRAHAAHGDTELARQAFRKAIELKPDYLSARLGLAQLEIRLGDFDAGLQSARQILAVDRNSVNARLIESAALMGLKKFGDSRAVLDDLLKANPSSPDTYYQIGILSLSQNKYKESEEAFRKAYQLNPANPRGLLGVVETQMAQNNPDSAIKVLQDEIAKGGAGRTDLVFNLANVAARAGRFDQAISGFEQVLNTLDKNASSRGTIYAMLGEVQRRKGDYPAAIANLQKAKEIQPENTATLVTMGIVLDTNLNRWTEAKSVYEAILKISPKNYVALNNLAFLLAEHGGDLDEALTKATQAKQLSPNTAEVSDTLGWIYLKKNLPDAALDLFKELVQKSPEKSTFRYHLGMALSMKGDKPKAIKELQEALKHNPQKPEKDKIQELLNRLTSS
jgi:tetratricopeptide (TPR) repeat protein